MVYFLFTISLIEFDSKEMRMLNHANLHVSNMLIALSPLYWQKNQFFRVLMNETYVQRKRELE